MRVESNEGGVKRGWSQMRVEPNEGGVKTQAELNEGGVKTWKGPASHGGLVRHWALYRHLSCLTQWMAGWWAL